MSKAKQRGGGAPRTAKQRAGVTERRDSRNVVLEADVVDAPSEADHLGDEERAREDSSIIEVELVDAEIVEAGADATPDESGAALATPGPEPARDDEVDPLADVGPVSDDDLDAIAREVLSGRSAPAGTAALAVRDPMGAYMAEVRRYPLLSREQEHELAKRWVETGDREAGRRLVTSNLRLVVKLANEYRRGYQNLLDLVQEGNVGLLKAVDRFDPYRGIKLSTYAAWWIRAYILKYILANWRLVKLGDDAKPAQAVLQPQQAAAGARGGRGRADLRELGGRARCVHPRGGGDAKATRGPGRVAARAHRGRRRRRADEARPAREHRRRVRSGVHRGSRAVQAAALGETAALWRGSQGARGGAVFGAVDGGGAGHAPEPGRAMGREP